MRIATQQFYRQSVESMQDNNARVAKTQEQISSGTKILTPADDPAGSKKILDLTQSIALHQQYQTNADAAKTRLSFEETALENAGNVLQRVRELAVQGANSTLGPTDRDAIGAEVSNLLDELLQIANSRDSGNEYLFSGYQGNTQPFARGAGGSFVYAGDQGQRKLQVGQTLQIGVSDSGADVFQTVRAGNGTFVSSENAANTGSGVIQIGSIVDPAAWVPDTYTITFTSPTDYEVRDSGANLVTGGTYTDGGAIAFNGAQVAITGSPATGDTFTVAPSPNQDLFATVQDLVSAMGMSTGDAASNAHFSNAMGRIIQNLDQGLEHVVRVRATVGARLNSVDSQQQMDSGFVLFAQQSLSSVQDLDYAEASSRFQLQLVTLQASQQAFVKIQGLSLFNYISP